MKTVVNVLGLGRSGTTVLDLMLGNADNAFSCGEVYAWFRPFRKHHFLIDCTCRDGQCPIWEKLKDVPQESFHDMVFRIMHVDFVIDSSKNLSWLVDTYKWLPPEVRIVNVVIWKDPIDVAYSYWKRGKKIDKGRYSFWANFLKYYNTLFDLKIPFMAVSYKQLVEDPQTKLRSVCEKVGMPYFEGKEKFWLKTHHFLFGSHGVRQQVISKRSFIYKKEFWPEQFKMQANYLQREIDASSNFQRILEILERYEVDNLDSLDYSRPLSVRKPVWYYLDYAVRLYRRYFPEDFERKEVGQAQDLRKTGSDTS